MCQICDPSYRGKCNFPNLTNVCPASTGKLQCVYVLSPEALRTENADLNGILAVHRHVTPDIPKDEFVSAYQEAVTYVRQNCKAPLSPPMTIGHLSFINVIQ